MGVELVVDLQHKPKWCFYLQLPNLMKLETLAIYNNGETLDWDDRVAIRVMAKLGVPGDYINWLEKYGWGVFAAGQGMQLSKPSNHLQVLAKQLKDPIPIAGRDDGIVYASDHVGKVLFDWVPRSNSEPGKTFLNFEEVLSWAMAREKPPFPIPLLMQPPTSEYSLVSKKALEKDDDVEFGGRISDAFAPNIIKFARWQKDLLAIGVADGFLIEIENGKHAKIHYGLGRDITKTIILLQGFGFVHKPNEGEDINLRLTGA